MCCRRFLRSSADCTRRHKLPTTNHTSRSRFNFRQICVPCMVDPAKLRKQLKTHYVWTIDNNHNEHICIALNNKNSSGDEIANVNFLLQHRTCRRQRLRPLNEFVISTKRLRYLPTHQTDCQNGLVRPIRFAPLNYK